MTGLTATVRQALVILATADAEQMRARVVIGGRIAGIAGRVAVLSARGDPHGIDLSPFPGTTWSPGAHGVCNPVRLADRI